MNNTPVIQKTQTTTSNVCRCSNAVAQANQSINQPNVQANPPNKVPTTRSARRRLAFN